MAEISAKDVQALRKASGAGMMDCKRALEENNGDPEAAMKWLREKGLAASAKRQDRENTEGAIAVAHSGNVAVIVELKSETDFVAKSDLFKGLAQDLAELVVAEGEGALAKKSAAIEDLKITLKENIEVGRVVRIEAADGNVLDTYTHVQSDRGIMGVIVEVANGSEELAHDVALHIAFARPKYLSRDEVPAEDVAAEREMLVNITRNEGKPEAALEKIVEGRLNGFFKDIVLLEQPFVRAEKESIEQHLGAAKIVRFAQVVIGG